MSESKKTSKKKGVKKPVPKKIKKSSGPGKDAKNPQRQNTASKKSKKTATTRSSDKGKKSQSAAASRELAVQKKSDKSIKKIENKKDVDPDSLARGDIPMTIVDHLDELRSRLIICLATVIILTIVAFVFSDQVLAFINQPFNETGQKLNIFKITGGFIIRLKTSLVAGILVGFPLVVLQLWKFIRPAVAKNDRFFSRVSIMASVLLFYGGIAFVFFAIIPFAIKMLLSFIGDDMLSTIGADDYISFILISSLIMGVLFELPIIIMILTRIGIITPHFLIRKRKYAIVIIWVVAAVITPQDVLTQILVAVPLMFLYEISIIISRVMFVRKRKSEAIEQN